MSCIDMEKCPNCGYEKERDFSEFKVKVSYLGDYEKFDSDSSMIQIGYYSWEVKEGIENYIVIPLRVINAKENNFSAGAIMCTEESFLDYAKRFEIKTE